METSDAVEMYPREPNPVTVDCKLAILLNPRPVEKEEKESETKLVVEINDKLET